MVDGRSFVCVDTERSCCLALVLGLLAVRGPSVASVQREKGSRIPLVMLSLRPSPAMVLWGRQEKSFICC